MTTVKYETDGFSHPAFQNFNEPYWVQTMGLAGTNLRGQKNALICAVIITFIHSINKKLV